MSYKLKTLTREDWERDPERIMQLLDEGLIMEKVVGSDVQDPRVDKCIEYASETCKRLCKDYYNVGMTGDDVERYFAIKAMEEPESFVKAWVGRRSKRESFFRFVAINVGCMLAEGIFLPLTQKKLAKALAGHINTMSEKSIYKRINDGYQMKK